MTSLSYTISYTAFGNDRPLLTVIADALLRQERTLRRL
jgi:hypothetical protein